MSAPASLQRSLRLPQATAMVVGIIIGASIFVQPSEITRQIPSVSGIMLAWLLAGALTMCGALVCAELASAFPESGGVYVFLNEAYSPALGFLWGWAMFWSMHSGIVAAVATVFARYAAFFVPMNDVTQKCVAMGVIGVLTAVNYVGVTHGGRVQTIVTGIKIFAIVVLVGAGLLIGSSAPHPAGVAIAAIGVRPFVLGIGARLFSFGGWHMVSYAAGETVDAAKTIPRALIIGTLIVTACYAGLNAIYLRVLPLDAVRASTRVAADAADALLGGGGAGLVAALVLVSTFGALNGIILSGPRVYFSMAERGVIFRGLGAVHPRFRTPSRAIVLQGVWSAALAWMSSYRDLFGRVVYTEWIFFALLAIGLVLLRRRADYRPAYRVWGYPFVPIVFAIAALYVAITQLAADPRSSAIGIGLVLAGLPVYFIWSRPRAHR